MRGARQPRDRRFYASAILVERRASDLYLGMRETHVDECAQFVRQSRDIVMRIEVSTAGVHADARRRDLPEAIRQEAMERQPGDLGGCVPHCHVERSDRHASLAVAAWLLTGHHDVPGAEWIKVDAAKIDEAVFGGAQEPGREALPDQAALCETADR